MTFTETWTEQQTAELVRLRALGWSSRQIGEEIGKSRNAVIGKANRLGLAAPTRSTITRKVRAAAGLERLPKTRKRGLTPDELEQELAGAKLRNKQLKLSELRADSCRWPMWPHDGTGDRVFCGQRARLGQPYCPEHHVMAHDRVVEQHKSQTFSLRVR